MHKPKSLASDIHAILISNIKVGQNFTAQELKVLVSVKGINASEGAIHGFLNRAMNKGMVKHTGHYTVGKTNSKAYVYMLNNTDAWAFKSASKGSPAGRKLHKDHPDFGDRIETAMNDKNLNVKTTPEVAFATDRAVSDWANKCAADGTATDEIMLRLGEVMALVEAQRGLMTKLSEFTDDEIADEVKRRFHSK